MGITRLLKNGRPAAVLRFSLLGLVLIGALLIMGGLYVGAYHNFSGNFCATHVEISV